MAKAIPHSSNCVKKNGSDCEKKCKSCPKCKTPRCRRILVPDSKTKWREKGWVKHCNCGKPMYTLPPRLGRGYCKKCAICPGCKHLLPLFTIVK
jgi:hypothetical protein